MVESNGAPVSLVQRIPSSAPQAIRPLAKIPSCVSRTLHQKQTLYQKSPLVCLDTSENAPRRRLWRLRANTIRKTYLRAVLHRAMSFHPCLRSRLHLILRLPSHRERVDHLHTSYSSHPSFSPHLAFLVADFSVGKRVERESLPSRATWRETELPAPALRPRHFLDLIR